jgi:hypothetical protein
MSVKLPSGSGASAFTQTDRSFLDQEGEAAPVFSGLVQSPVHAWNVLIDELLRIRNLDHDWDGEGTEAPDPMLVDGAITLAHRLKLQGYPPADRVHASVNGTVYFEWHTLPFGYQEIEVTSPVDTEVRCVPRG